ncbi:MAG: nonstructural protein [Microviridae sp.]|nr:MAG: nonstructural protein [Microviridae sp.]
MSRLFAFYDDKAMFFMPPAVAANENAIMRSLRAAKDEMPDAPFVRYPGDFILYDVGSFDEQTGVVDGLAVPRRVATFSEIFAQFAT